MYKTEPAFAIELLERKVRKHPKNLSYRLTLADMYKDRGRVNDAIRIWFEILYLSSEQKMLKGKALMVYYIPIAPYQEEGMRPYDRKIDKTLAYTHIASIYYQNAFYEDASEYFSKAGEQASEPNEKASLYLQAGQAIGSKEMEPVSVESAGREDQQHGEKSLSSDPLGYRTKEIAFYEMALALDFPDQGLREAIVKMLTSAKEEVLHSDANGSERLEKSSVSNDDEPL